MANHKASHSSARTIGPVTDLERHLPTEWWKTLFNALYLKTDGDVVENTDATVAEVDCVLAVTGAAKDQKILDLCCGQGRHSLELARRGFDNVIGIDRSRYLVRLARKRAQREHFSTKFHEGDARNIRMYQNEIDLVLLLGNSFGYFESEDDDAKIIEQIAKILRKDGVVYFDIADGDFLRAHYEKRSWEWIDPNHFVCRERELARDSKRLISREVIVNAETGVIADQFYAERLYNQQQLTDLLERSGFNNVRFHAAGKTISDRSQDLGMLSQRLVCTAVYPKTTSVAVGAAKRIPVTVLLGDPSLPDPVKLNHQFNQEDLTTVQKMKDAVSEVTDCEFSFVDDHETMLSTLLTKSPAFVLNLCDEGYQNDPFKELHVPAVLEMLGIPYTGAGPACLGMCYNKSLVSLVASSLDIATPLETYFDQSDVSATLPSIFPALVKPNFGDSSIGITSQAVVHSPEQLINYVANLRSELPDVPILLQEYLSGPEYSVGLIGNPGMALEHLPILEVDYSGLPSELPPILGYESKWDPQSPYWTDIRYKQAALSDDMRRILIDQSSLLFERLGCRDYARFDYRCTADGQPKLLEVNPNPGWCWDGKLNIMADWAGWSYGDLLRHVLEAGLLRAGLITSKLS